MRKGGTLMRCSQFVDRHVDAFKLQQTHDIPANHQLMHGPVKYGASFGDRTRHSVLILWFKPPPVTWDVNDLTCPSANGSWCDKVGAANRRRHEACVGMWNNTSNILIGHGIQCCSLSFETVVGGVRWPVVLGTLCHCRNNSSRRNQCQGKFAASKK